jgi:hypothetical protein
MASNRGQGLDQKEVIVSKCKENFAKRAAEINA